MTDPRDNGTADSDTARRTTRTEGGRRVRGPVREYEPNKPIVSVITVVFNDKAGIERLIKNIAQQSYRNIEYIVVDGGSTDGTLDIIRRHEDLIDHWTSEKDKGIYDAMNKGVSLATGEWVNFMNAGDSFYAPTTVAEIMESMPPSVDLVYGHTYYNEDGRMRLIETYSIDTLWKSMICSHQSIFARRCLLTARPFNLAYKISSDFDFIYYSYTKGAKFHDTKKIVAVHSVDGVSEQRIIRRMLERWKIVRGYTPSAKANLFYLSLLLKKIERVLKGPRR